MPVSPALLLAGLALLAAVQAQPPSSMRPTPDIVGERISPRRECPMSCSPDRAGAPRKHVCGTDGKTYPSACHLRRQQCHNQNSNIKLDYRGKCRPNKAQQKAGSSSGIPACLETRRFHLSKDSEQNKFVPECDKNGHFVPLQCYKVYCWCVQPNTGSPISNTYSENTKPDCSKEVRKGNNKGPNENKRFPARPPTSPGTGLLDRNRTRNKPKKECDGVDKITFNKNLLNLVLVEMRHLPIAGRTDNLGEIILEKTNDPSTQRRILELKFSMLDENHDNVLEKKEYRGFRKIARTNVTPRRCSRTFIQRCDKDDNSIITKQEWLKCLGLNTPKNRKPVLPDEDESSSSEQDSSEGRGCLHERKTAMEQVSGNNYVPQCTHDGKYERAQCYSNTGYCFCVDEENGKLVPDSMVAKKIPQCNKGPVGPSAISRPMDKCPEERKKRFIREFKALMGAKVEFNGRSGFENFGDDDNQETLIASSFFNSLDKNSDLALDKKEWKEFRKIVEERASLRQCGKKFLRYCDSNEDSRVTLAEWNSCLNFGKASRAPELFTDISSSTTPGIRHGKNPFMDLLVSDD